MGLGTNRLTETPDNVAFIRAAVDAGIGLIDTAHLYTGGSSESTIGAALGGRTDGPVVATKGGFRAGEGSRQTLTAQIAESLRRLRTDRITLYYLHRVDPETPFEESLETLREHRERGVIEHVGLSAVSVEQIEEARQILPIAAVQNQFNLGDRSSDDVVDYCEREQIAFVPFYPLHAPSTDPQLALAWLLRRSSVMLPIPGTLSLAHVRQNVAALDVELTDAQFEALSGRG
jgi:aryl-alcohol dehydrogenase-like predicted oxidoreductase